MNQSCAIDHKDTRSSLQSPLSKAKPNCIPFHSFQPYLPTNGQEIRHWIQWRVCSRTMRSFHSWLHGRHQFPLPALKLRAILAIWFDIQIVSGANFRCPWDFHRPTKRDTYRIWIWQKNKFESEQTEPPALEPSDCSRKRDTQFRWMPHSLYAP